MNNNIGQVGNLAIPSPVVTIGNPSSDMTIGTVA